MDLVSIFDRDGRAEIFVSSLKSSCRLERKFSVVGNLISRTEQKHSAFSSPESFLCLASPLRFVTALIRFRCGTLLLISDRGIIPLRNLLLVVSPFLSPFSSFTQETTCKSACSFLRKTGRFGDRGRKLGNQDIFYKTRNYCSGENTLFHDERTRERVETFPFSSVRRQKEQEDRTTVDKLAAKLLVTEKPRPQLLRQTRSRQFFLLRRRSTPPFLSGLETFSITLANLWLSSLAGSLPVPCDKATPPRTLRTHSTPLEAAIRSSRQS